MASNPATAYGSDIACIVDADALFSSATGLAVVVQDVIHRLTTNDVLGPGGDGWGFDVRQLVGAPAARITSMQPVLSEVLQRDPRILTADVTLTATTSAAGLADVLLDVRCTTSAGPFALILPVSQLTGAVIEAQAAA